MGNFIQGKYRDDDTKNKFKGDALEILAEIFFLLHPTDERVGLKNYEHIPIVDDYGVDGKGINPNGVASVVQVKYRSNVTEHIDFADMSRTFGDAIEQCWIKQDESHNLYLFTNCAGSTIPVQKRYGNHLVEINRGKLKEMVDGNKTFWLTAAELVYKTLCE